MMTEIQVDIKAINELKERATPDNDDLLALEIGTGDDTGELQKVKLSTLKNYIAPGDEYPAPIVLGTAYRRMITGGDIYTGIIDHVNESGDGVVTIHLQEGKEIRSADVQVIVTCGKDGWGICDLYDNRDYNILVKNFEIITGTNVGRKYIPFKITILKVV